VVHSTEEIRVVRHALPAHLMHGLRHPTQGQR
jgi:hypothetical protein